MAWSGWTLVRYDHVACPIAPVDQLSPAWAMAVVVPVSPTVEPTGAVGVGILPFTQTWGDGVDRPLADPQHQRGRIVVACDGRPTLPRRRGFLRRRGEVEVVEQVALAAEGRPHPTGTLIPALEVCTSSHARIAGDGTGATWRSYRPSVHRLCVKYFRSAVISPASRSRSQSTTWRAWIAAWMWPARPAATRSPRGCRTRPMRKITRSPGPRLGLGDLHREARHEGEEPLLGLMDVPVARIVPRIDVLDQAGCST